MCAQTNELAWPRTLTADDGMQVTFFQPQVDSWEYYAVLDYHMAIELRFPGASSTVPGTLRMTGQTSTDVGAQTVALYSQEIVRRDLPRRRCRHRPAVPVHRAVGHPDNHHEPDAAAGAGVHDECGAATATTGTPPGAAGPNPKVGPGLPPRSPSRRRPSTTASRRPFS